MGKDRPVGFWVLQGLAVVLLVFLLIGQTGALIDYDRAVALGLQEAASEITEIGVSFNKGFAAADTVVYAPLLALGIVGHWLRYRWGLVAMAAAMGITAYWPIVSLWTLYAARGTPGFSFTSHALYTAILLPIAAYGIWALFFLYRDAR